jgi:hypothetical protein|tara:strand:- start:19 stop:600 length:582 start_codon:yes stop_codon:yes gene_type:complete
MSDLEVQQLDSGVSLTDLINQADAAIAMARPAAKSRELDLTVRYTINEEELTRLIADGRWKDKGKANEKRSLNPDGKKSGDGVMMRQCRLIIKLANKSKSKKDGTFSFKDIDDKAKAHIVAYDEQGKTPNITAGLDTDTWSLAKKADGTAKGYVQKPSKAALSYIDWLLGQTCYQGNGNQLRNVGTYNIFVKV